MCPHLGPCVPSSCSRRPAGLQRTAVLPTKSLATNFEIFRAWYNFFIFVKETRKEAYPAPPFCAPGLSASWTRKTGRFGTLPSAPKFPLGKKTRARFQNRDFSDFCQFRSSENRVSEVFQDRKTAKRQKNGNFYASHTPHLQQARQRGAGRMEAQRGWGGGDARESAHTPCAAFSGPDAVC